MDQALDREIRKSIKGQFLKRKRPLRLYIGQPKVQTIQLIILGVFNVHLFNLYPQQPSLDAKSKQNYCPILEMLFSYDKEQQMALVLQLFQLQTKTLEIDYQRSFPVRIFLTVSVKISSSHLGTVHLGRWQIFMTFDPYPPPVDSFFTSIHPQIWPILDPSTRPQNMPTS